MKVHRTPSVLLVNDDGIGATGLEKLRIAARDISDDIWVVAPSAERSGAAHSISLTVPLRVRKLADREFAVDGTPVDCVALALGEILDRKPDLVISGVNRGPNLADDVLYSGTCGAAREAAQRGISAIAVSMVAYPGPDDDWGAVEGHLPGLLGRLLRSPGLLNVNIPGLPAEQIVGTRITRVGAYPGTRFRARPGRDPRGLPYWWMQLEYPPGPYPAGTDIAAIDERFISISPLRVDVTDDARLDRTAELLSAQDGASAVASSGHGRNRTQDGMRTGYQNLGQPFPGEPGVVIEH